MSSKLVPFLLINRVLFHRTTETKAEHELSTAVIELKKRLLAGITVAKNGLSYVTYLLKVAKLPIPSVRYAGVDLLTAVASNGWGLLALATVHDVHPEGDFIAYLVSRESEYSKEGKDWKFSLIQAVAANPSRHLLGDINTQIDKLVQQGAYYMPAKMADMMTI